MSQDRRNFLKHVGTGAAAAVAVAKITEQVAPAAESSAFAVLSAARSPQIKIALELEGVMAGWLQSAEGGQATADIVIEKVGTDGVARKHLAGVKYEDITVNCGAGMSKAFYQWIQDSFDQKHTRKNGAIKAVDYDYNVRSVQEFTDAILSEVTFPALDAGSKDAAKMTIKFAPEITRTKAGSGKIDAKFADTKHQKLWSPANFRLTIDGLDAACSKVNKIEALTIKQKIVEHAVGEGLTVDQEPASLEFPNLKISLPEAYAEQFADWHEDFVIKGNNGQDKEKTGALEYLDPTQTKVLLAISIHNLGIFKYEPDALSENNSDKIRHVKAEMYCEEIRFSPPKSTGTD